MESERNYVIHRKVQRFPVCRDYNLGPEKLFPRAICNYGKSIFDRIMIRAFHDHNIIIFSRFIKR